MIVGKRFAAAAIAPFVERTEPYTVTPEQYAAFSDPPAGGSGSYMIAPFTIEGRWGAIAVAAPADVDFGDRELELVGGLAHQAKLAIANASSFAGLERTFLSTVEALANALEARDEYTSSHARWITDTALRVGQELGLDGDTLKRLELGALFHDIGKIGIPNSVLLKPGPLTDEERQLIETHPELGEKIIAPIDQLQDVCGIVRACHERWDGQGYPDRKAGDEIPLEARIIFACDAYHAMTTDRPYRRALAVGGGAPPARGSGGHAVRPAGRRRLPARARSDAPSTRGSEDDRRGGSRRPSYCLRTFRPTHDVVRPAFADPGPGAAIGLELRLGVDHLVAALQLLDRLVLVRARGGLVDRDGRDLPAGCDERVDRGLRPGLADLVELLRPRGRARRRRCGRRPRRAGRRRPSCPPPAPCRARRARR